MALLCSQLQCKFISPFKKKPKKQEGECHPLSPSLNFFLQIHSCFSSNNTHTYTHTHALKLDGKLNIIQQQQWPAEALCGTVQQLCETAQTHYANTLTSKQVPTLQTKHVTHSPVAVFGDMIQNFSDSGEAGIFAQANNSLFWLFPVRCRYNATQACKNVVRHEYKH